jgi:hypothetical protein
VSAIGHVGRRRSVGGVRGIRSCSRTLSMASMVAVTCALEMVVRLVSDSSAPASAPPSAVPTVPDQPSSRRVNARVAWRGVSVCQVDCWVYQGLRIARSRGV